MPNVFKMKKITPVQIIKHNKMVNSDEIEHQHFSG